MWNRNAKEAAKTPAATGDGEGPGQSKSDLPPGAMEASLNLELGPEFEDPEWGGDPDYWRRPPPLAELEPKGKPAGWLARAWRSLLSRIGCRLDATPPRPAVDWTSNDAWSARFEAMAAEAPKLRGQPPPRPRLFVAVLGADVPDGSTTGLDRLDPHIEPRRFAFDEPRGSDTGHRGDAAKFQAD